jgi:hypothetical protein
LRNPISRSDRPKTPTAICNWAATAIRREGLRAERALSFTIEAGDQAVVRYAHAEAARHYQVGLDQLVEIGEIARAADVQYRLAGELYDLNHLAGALAAYEAALATFEVLGDFIGQARVHRGIGPLHHGRYDMSTALPYFHAALRLWPPDREDAPRF